MSNWIYGLLLGVSVSSIAYAAPITFTFQNDIVESNAAEIAVGDIFTLTVVADNGNNSLVSQSWLKSDIVSATASVGSYSATFQPPHFGFC